MKQHFMETILTIVITALVAWSVEKAADAILSQIKDTLGHNQDSKESSGEDE